MDATTVGTLFAFVGVLSGSVVAFFGKRGENATARFNSVTDQVQEERDQYKLELAATRTELRAVHQQRYADLEEMTRLRIKIIRLGGDPDDPT